MRRGAAWVALAVAVGCGDGPFLPFLGTARLSDPAGDTFETAASAGLVPPDVVALEVDRTTATLRFAIEFADPVSPDPASPSFLIGFLELDLDQDVDTGLRPSLIERFDPAGGFRALGVEVEIQFREDGRVRVRNPIEDAVLGFLDPLYEGSRVTLEVPLALLGDEGLVTFALIVGTLAEPTDVAPDAGVVRLEAS